MIHTGSKVFIWWNCQGDKRVWLTGHEQIRNRNGELILKPTLDNDPHEAIAVRFDLAQVFKRRLDSEGCLHPSFGRAQFSLTPEGIGLEADPADSDAAEKAFYEVNREPVIATLDDATWFVVRPANTVNGPQWFLKIRVPGRPTVETIYAADPLAVLQRAHDLGWLKFAEKYV